MNKVWFTSDLHHKHKRIVEFTNRGLETTQEFHDEWLRDIWNSTVHKSDTVYHLGDLSFSKDYNKTVEWLDSLNGNKVLIKGNHDYSDAFHAYKFAKNTRTEVYLEKTFEISGRKQHICMFHFAISSWHKQHYGSWMLHGHSHGAFQGQGKILDVGIDNAYNLYKRHCFFDLEMIESFMLNREVFIADQHRNYKGDL